MKRCIEIKNPLPLKDQETAISRMRGERWRVDTSEPTVARALQRKGHAAVGDDGAGHYLRFELPANALTFRSMFALGDSRRAENLPNGSTIAEGSTPKPSEVREKLTQDRAIDYVDDSSPAPGATEPELAPKSSKGGKSTAGTPDVEIRLAGRSE